MNRDMPTAFRRAVLASLLASLLQGKLGRHNTDGTVSLEVRGRPNYVWITRRDQTAVEALNKAGVPLIEDLPVEYREEHGSYVILGRSSHPSQEPAESSYMRGIGNSLEWLLRQGRLRLSHPYPHL